MGETLNTTADIAIKPSEAPSEEVLHSPNLHYYVHLRECVCSYLDPEGVIAVELLTQNPYRLRYYMMSLKIRIFLIIS